jgi:hypothetical protein
MQAYSKLAIVLIGPLMLLATLAPAIASPSLSMPPAIGVMRASNSSWSSTNWSGYAVTGSTNSVTFAYGSWAVPAVSAGTSPTTTYYAAFWVGIDGFSSNTVEQTGTLSEIQGSTKTYYAWYEFYPSPMYEITSLSIKPNDVISANVTYTGSGSTGFFHRTASTFTVTITDVTTGKSFSTSGSVSGASRSSAEWIAEAPSSYGVLPLANFGTASYGSDYTGIKGTCYATISGVSGQISSFGSAVQKITMVTNRGVTKAAPTAMSNDGTSFQVAWASAGP